MSLSEFFVDAILGPFRLMWEILPPEFAVPMIAITVLVYAKVMAGTEEMIEESADQEKAVVGGYNPDTGYKFSPEEFDT